MTELKQIYKCNVCGNITEVIHTGVGELVCCGQPMELQKEKTQDEGKEKHIPVIEEKEDRAVVKIGSVPHPMEEDHFIEWVELGESNDCCRRFLKSGDKPEADFWISKKSPKPDGISGARVYCNVHGLWKK